MTPKELLVQVRSLHTGDCPDQVLLQWLDELEGRIALEIHGEKQPPRPASTRLYMPLSVSAPYTRLYWTYLLAMLDLAEGNKQAYACSNALFCEAYGAYARHVAHTGGVRRG